MQSSPFGTHRGKLVGRVLIYLGVLALGLIFAARVAGGDTAPTARDGQGNVFPEERAPKVEPFVADPFLADPQTVEVGLDRSRYSGQDLARFDAAVATAVKFAQAYATYDAGQTWQSYVDGLAGASDEFRQELREEAAVRWTEYRADKTLAAARLSGVPAAVVLFDQLKSAVRVQLLQDITGLSGQHTTTLTYRVELTWAADASAGPSPGPAASPGPGLGELGGAWSVVRIRFA